MVKGLLRMRRRKQWRWRWQSLLHPPPLLFTLGCVGGSAWSPHLLPALLFQRLQRHFAFKGMQQRGGMGGGWARRQ